MQAFSQSLEASSGWLPKWKEKETKDRLIWVRDCGMKTEKVMASAHRAYDLEVVEGQKLLG